MTEADLIVPADKGTHFIAGSILFAIAMAVTHSPVRSLLVVAAVGGGKEVLWDWGGNWLARRRGKPVTRDPSWLDFIATLAGGIACFLAVLAS